MQAEAQIRDAKGEWRPSPLPAPSPITNGPWKPAVLLKHLWNVLWPYNLIYAAMAFAVWLWLTPSATTTARFRVDWIALLFLRNAALLTVVAGALHLRMYIQRAQGVNFKYSDKWLATKDRKFTFGDQTRDNVFWSVVSGCGIWTAYEAVTLWLYSNGVIPMFDMRQHPVWAVVLTLGVIYFRYFHFYWVHRLIHWKPLYKPVHSLHHRNINVGPWSGLSMHPLEHIVYFSAVLIHWVVPSSPFHAIFNLLHAGISPAVGHLGFHRMVVDGEKGLASDGYFHYLHHRLFTVNFGVEAMPLDWWFGTQHDGSAESLARIRGRLAS